jgi:hypothetical protein
MVSRVVFALITLFWLVMNVLLWRAEYSRTGGIGSTLPAAVVWARILTAPDNSTLDVRYHDRHVGFCRWAASVGDQPGPGPAGAEADEPEGMVRQPSGYAIDLGGNVGLNSPTNRLRFDLRVRFAPDRAWRQFRLRAAVPPQTWHLQSAAADHSLQVAYEGEGIRWDHTFTLAELQHPQKLLQEFGLPPMFSLPPLASGPVASPPLALGLNWEARNDWFRIGRSPVRVYRLEARLLDKYRIVAYVSRVGEILRVELPDRLVLVNDALANY